MSKRIRLLMTLLCAASLPGAAGIAADVGMTGAVKSKGKELVEKSRVEPVSSPERTLIFSFISTVAGTGVPGFSGDGGPAADAKLYSPRDMTVDSSGNIYIADAANHRIRKISAVTGFISTVAGSGENGYGGDGGAATSASLYMPSEVCLDSSGNIYIADSYNDCIRKVLAGSGIIITVAGTGTAGYDGDGGPAVSALLDRPLGVCLDSARNIYIADTFNNRIRKVSADTGYITTVAGTGTGGYNGDGMLATSAMISFPMHVFVDAASNIYISEFGNLRVRRVSAATGLISTVAGTGTAGYNGDGIPAVNANLDYPWGLYVDGMGNIYIGDAEAHRVRKVAAATGLISTVAGTGTDGYNGDGIPPTSAELDTPEGVFAADGCVYIADTSNHRIRKIQYIYNF